MRASALGAGSTLNRSLNNSSMVTDKKQNVSADVGVSEIGV